MSGRGVLTVLLGAGLLMSGCGNFTRTAERRAQIVEALRPDERPTIAELRGNIDFAVANTSGPLLLVEQPAQNQGAFFARAAESNGVVTYGSDAQSTISLRGPVVVATRGFGEDLMSVEVGPLPDLLAAREEGRYTRVMRFLDSLDQTREMRFECALSRRQGSMVEYCGSAAHEYTNVYRYGTDNRIAASEQWVGDGNGVLVVRQLR